MKALTKENVLQFEREVKPSEAVRSWRVADLYDWLGGKSRIPSYYRMKELPINQRDKLAQYIYNRQYNEYRKEFVKWAREVFDPFLSELDKLGKVKAATGRWGFCAFFEFYCDLEGELVCV